MIFCIRALLGTSSLFCEVVVLNHLQHSGVLDAMLICTLNTSPPQDGVYGIDSDGPPGEKPNQILIDLGKSMERMLTLVSRPPFYEKIID